VAQVVWTGFSRKVNVGTAPLTLTWLVMQAKQDVLFLFWRWVSIWRPQVSQSTGVFVVIALDLDELTAG
jgi:hypothetical protein